MARKSDNPIPNMDTDWGRDPQNGLPFSGQSVQSFIKQSFNEKVGAASFDSETMTIYLFKNAMDKAEFEEDHSKKTLAIGTVPLEFGIQYRIKVNPDNGTSISASINQDSVNLDMDLRVESREIGEPVWIATGHDISVRVFVDAGVTGTYVEVPSLAQTVIATVGRLSVDVKQFIQTGTNRVRLFFTAVDEESISSSIVFNVTLAEMYIEAWEGGLMWNRPIREDDYSTDYSIGGFRVVGNIVKHIHLRISRASEVVAYYDYDLVNQEFTANALFFGRTYGLNLASPVGEDGSSLPALETGVYTVKAWLTSGTLSMEDNAVIFNIMYIASGEQDTARLVVMNNSGSDVNNYDEAAHLCDYAIYDRGASSAQVTITTTAYQSSVPMTPVIDTITVETGTVRSLTKAINVVTSEDNLRVHYKVALTSSIYADDWSRVDNTEIFPYTTGATFYLNPSLRDNGEGSREILYNTAGNSAVAIDGIEWQKMSWVNGMDGWTEDGTGRKCLYLPARSRLVIPSTSFNFLSATPISFEFCYRVSNVSDYSENVISIAQNPTAEGFKGIRIRPTNITLHSGNDGSSENDIYQGTNVSDESVIHLVVTIQPSFAGSGKNLVTGYINGTKNFQFEYSGSWVNTAASAIFGSNSADLSVYLVRVYKGVAISDADVEKNWLSSFANRSEKVTYKAWIDSVLREGTRGIGYDTIKNSGKYNFFVVEMTSGAGIPSKTYPEGGRANIEMHYGVDENGNSRSGWDWKIYDVETQGQGTTSKNYWLWNLRMRIDKTDSSGERMISYYDDPTVVGKVRIFNELVPTSSKTVWFDGHGNHPAVKRITAKINFASSMQSHKMGATKAYNILHDEMNDGALLNEAQAYAVANNLPMPTVAVYQYPAFGFQKIDDNYIFIGLFTIGPDKGDKPTFGYDLVKNSLITLEGTDHNQPLAKFAYPWIAGDPVGGDGSVSYFYGEEGISINLGNNKYQTGFELSNCHNKEIDAKNKDNKAYEDQPLIRQILDDEFKDAYELAWQNSTLIFPITAEHDYYDRDVETTIANINSHLDGDTYETNFRMGKIDEESRLSYADMQFWVKGDSSYTLYYYDVVDGIYKPDVSLYDQNGAPVGNDADEENEWFKKQRRERFMESFGDYFDIYDTLFHYVFLLVFGATDNFAKNMYPYKMATLQNDGRWRWRQDDLDTILDIDNNGGQTKSSDIEYGDAINGSPVFAGSSSTLWNLVYETLWDDFTVDGVRHPGIKTVGQDMLETMSELAGGVNLYDGFIKFFEKYFWGNAQDYFSPSAYNLDASLKYESAWLASGQTAVDPLRQSLGNHYSAERLWVRRRALYCLSLFELGPFSNYSYDYLGQMQLRPNSLGVLTVTTAESMYPGLIIGARDNRPTARTLAGKSMQFTGLNNDGNTVYTIQAMDYITSIGDLKNLVLGNDDGGKLTVSGKKLRTIKLGDENGLLVGTNVSTLAIDVNGLPCLEVVDVRNVSGLSSNLDLTNCKRIKEVYAEGTLVPSVSLPRGSKIEKLHLPENVSTISYQVIKYLSDLVLPDDPSGISTLYLEECDALNAFDTLETIYNTPGQDLQFIRLLWNTEVSVNGAQIRMLSNIMQNLNSDGTNHLSEYHGIDASGVSSDEYNPYLEGRIITDGYYAADLNRLAGGNTPSDSALHPGMKEIRSSYFGPLYITYALGDEYIVFEDQDTLDEVLDLNVGDGYGVTHDQADAVTNWNSAFKNNTNIGAFSEFRYFTAITNMGSIFQGSSVTKVTLPGGIGFSSSTTNFGNLFYGCSSLTEIDFNDAVRLPSAKSTQLDMFTNCSALTTIRYSSFSQVFDLCYNSAVASEIPFGYNTGAHHVYINGSEVTEFTIPSNLQAIPAGAFYRWNRVTSITIPNSITTIGNLAFHGCSRLSELTIPSSVTSVDVNAVRGFGGLVEGGSTLIVQGNLINSDNSSTIDMVSNVIVGGYLNNVIGAAVFGKDTVSVRIGGNVIGSGGPLSYAGSLNLSKLSFIEIMGKITSGRLFYTPGERRSQSENGCIVHLGYDTVENQQLACTAARIFYDSNSEYPSTDISSRLHIYVGIGDETKDEQILQMYLNDSSWSNFSRYLSTWYSYVQGGGVYAESPFDSD